MGDDEVLATSNGFIQCLRMLAEEASILRLDQTSAALQRALDTCHLEVSAGSSDSLADRMPAGLAIH